MSQDTVKVSILVPIFNVERYLLQCLRSLINQTLYKIEIICINDGSTDKSLEIIKNIANYDSRVIIIDKHNSGYGDSMNKGLEIARGEYIGIVESDDFVEPDMFETLYTLASVNKLDIVKSSYYKYWDDKNEKLQKEKYFSTYNKIFVPNKNQSIYCVPPSIWSAIYRRDYLLNNNIRFLPTPGASYQDTSFYWKTLFFANAMMFVDHAFLHYRQDNPSSSVKCCTLKKAEFVNIEFNEIYKFILDAGGNFKILENMYNTNKLRSYFWNIHRVSKHDRRLYVNTIHSEINDILIKQKYCRQYFSKTELATLWCISSHNYYILELISLLKKAKRRVCHVN